MNGTGCSSAERRPRPPALARKAVALALSWTLPATTVWSAAPAPHAGAPVVASHSAEGRLADHEAREETPRAHHETVAGHAGDERRRDGDDRRHGDDRCDAGFWGPRRFTRTSGAPNVYTETVSVPAWVAAPHRLTLINGEADGRRRISSAWISVNGVQVLGPGDFSPQVATLARDVRLQATATLEVKLASAPGSFLQIAFCGRNGDHTPPAIAWSEPADGSSTRDTTPRLSLSYRDTAGAAEPGASGVDPDTLSVTLDGVDRTALFVRRSADASAELPDELALPEGLHQLVASVRDHAGNRGESTARFSVDVTPPHLSFAEPAAGGFVRPPVRIRLLLGDGTVTDPAGLRILVNEIDRTSAFSRAGTDLVAELDLRTGLVEGANNVEAHLADPAGNDAAAAVAFNVDTTAPTISIATPASGSRHGSADVEVAIGYRDDQALDPATLAVTVDGRPLALTAAPDGASGWVGPLVDGPHALAASVRDRAGNSGAAAATFVVDTGAPALQIAAPSAGALVGTATPELLVVYSDADGIDTSSLRVLVNGSDRTTLLSVGPDAASGTLPAAAALPEGPNRVTAEVADLSGNRTSATVDFVVDTAGPTIAFDGPPARTSDPSPLASVAWSDAVSGVDPASARILLDGVDRTALFAVDAARASGVLALEPRLPDGEHEITVSVADRAGNRSERASRFTLDTTRPEVVVASPATDSFTNDATPDLRITWADPQGTGIDPNSAHVFLQRGEEAEREITATLQVSPEGAIGSVPDSAPLEDGTWTLRVAAADLAGNVGTAEARFEVDTIAPTYVVEAPANGAALATATPAFDIRYADDRSGIDTSRLVLLVDGVDRSARLTLTPGRATGALTAAEALGDGEHTLELHVLDKAGNTAQGPPLSFRVDTVAPVAAVELPANGSFVGTASPQVKVTFADGGSAPSGVDTTALRIEIDGADHSEDFQVGDGTAVGQPGTPLADGPHAVVVRVADVAGNTATGTAGFVVDTQPPAVHDVSVEDGAWIARLDGDGRLTLSGQLQDLDSRLSVECSVAGGASVAGTVGAGGFSCAVPLAEGANQVEVRVTDGGGHSTTLTRNLNVDTTAPTVRILDPADGSYTNATSLTVTGTVVDRSAVTVSVAGVPAIVSGQSFVATGVPVGDPGRLVVRATATDAAKNTSSHEVGLTVDRNPPVVRITRPRPGDAVRGTPVAVEGTFEDESPVSMVYVNGQPALVEPSGATSGRFSTSLSTLEGALTIEAAAHDAAGNVGTDSVPAVVDSTAPTLTIVEPASGTVTNGSTLHVAGRVTDQTSVTLQVGGLAAAVGPDGSFAADVPLGGADGAQTIAVSAADAAGNTAGASVDVTVDRTPPELEIASPADGATVGALPVVVQGVVHDLTATSVMVDGQPATRTATAWTVTVDALPDGAHAFDVVATDGAGNRTVKTVHVDVDLSPPTVRIEQPASGTSTRESTALVGGTVTPATASVVVNGTPATVESGRFTATVSLAEGDNTIVAVAQRPGSQRTGEDTIIVTRDATPPVVMIAAPEVVARERAGRVSVTATDNVAMAVVEIRLGDVTLGRFAAPPYEADLVVPETARSGDTLTVTASATDAAGNTTTVTRGVRVAAAGVVVGQVLDAATGQPLAGATVRLLSGTAGASTSSDARGRFSLPAEDTQVAIRAEREGFLPVDRQASLVSGVGNVVVDARLTALAAPVAVGPAGGQAIATPVTLDVPAGALGGATGVRLTSLSPQALPGLLPLGFSPIVAFDVRSDSGTPLLQPLSAVVSAVSGSPAGAALQLVAYRSSTHGWYVVARDLTPAADGSLTFALPQLTTYALVVADSGEPAVVVAEPGQDLAGVDFVPIPADARTSGLVTPATLPPSGGTAEGDLSLVTATPLPSGTVVQAEIGESYALASGATASEEKRLQDVVLYRAPSPEGAALAARFPITPSRAYDAADLVEGRVHLDILAGREAVRGRTGGNDALTLTDGTLSVSIGSGSLAQDTAVDLEANEVSPFLPQVQGLTALREGVLDLSGSRLSDAAELSIDAGVAPAGGTLLVARVDRIDGVPALVLVSLATRAGDRIVSVPTAGLPGVRQEGRYVFLRYAGAVGFVAGTVSSPSGGIAAVVSTDGLPFVADSGPDGAYVVPAIAGAVSVSARPFGIASATAAQAQVIEGQTTRLDLTLAAATVLATVTPADGAVGLPASTQVEIATDAPLDPATVTTANVRLLKGDVVVPIRLVLAGSGRRLAVVPQATLEPSTTYALQALGLLTTQQVPVSVPRALFTTRDDVAPAYDVEALQFSFPRNGVVTVSAAAGSFPSGTSVLIIDSGNGVVLTLTVGNDGSLSGELPASIDDQLLVTLTDPLGKATTFTRSQFRAEDGTTAIGPGGGTVEGTGGVELRVPQGATEKGVVLKVEVVDPATIPASERPDFGIDAQGAALAHLGAALKVTSPDRPTFKKEVDLAFPVPADAPPGAFFYVLRRLSGPDGRVAHETLDHAFVEGEGAAARVVTASPPFSGFTDFAGTFDASAAIAKTDWNISFLLWTYDQAQPGQALASVITGKVLRATWDPGATTPSYEPVPAGSLVVATDAAGNPLTETSGAIVARTQADGTFTLFDPQNTGGSVTIAANVAGQWRTATVYEMASDTRSPSLRFYRDVFTANVTFPAEAPAAPPPDVQVYVMDEANGARRILPNGLALVGSPLVVGFRLKNGGLLSAATIQGQTIAVRRDTLSQDEPLAMDYVTDATFTPERAGTYTVTATVLPVSGAPITASRTFRALAAGGSSTDNLPNDPPAVIGEQTVPPTAAPSVSPSVFPQVVFSEPVRNVLDNVRLLELPSGEPVELVLSGVGPDEHGQLVVWDPIPDASTAVTSVTLQPRGGLKFGTRYRIEVANAVVDLDVDDAGAPAPKALAPAPYVSEFTTFGPQLLTRPDPGEQFGSPGLAVLGSTLYMVQNSFQNGTLRAFDVSNPVFVRPLTLDGDTFVWNRPVDIAGEGNTVLVATGPTNVSKPSNLFVFDVSDLPHVRWVGAAGLTNGAADGFISRVTVKDGLAYSATFRKGVQVVDLSRARSNFAQAVGDQAYGSGYWDMLQQLNTDGRQFGASAVVSATPVTAAGGQPARLNDLKVMDAVVSGRSQPTVVTVGDVGLAVVDPQGGGTLAQGPVESEDGSSRIDVGTAVAVGRVADRPMAVLAGSGVTGDPPAAATLLAVVDLSVPDAPQALGFLPLPEPAVDIVLKGDLALVTSTSRTYLVRVTDPTRPFLAGPAVEEFGGRLTLSGDSGVAFATDRSLFGGSGTAGGLRSAVVEPGGSCSLLSLRTPRVLLEMTQDVLNQTLCGAPAKLVFGLCGSALVTLSVDGRPLTATVDGEAGPRSIDGVLLGPGTHVVWVPPTTVGTISDTKPFAIEARSSEDPSRVERDGGTIEADLQNRSVLPVGHTFVKGVDIFDGHVVRQSTDLKIPGRHLGLELTRTYSSAAKGAAGEMGAGWSFNFAAAVTPSTCGLYVVSTSDGSSQTFRTGDNGRTFTAQKGYHTRLVRNGDGSYDFTDKAGNRHHFREPVDPTSGSQAYRLDYVEEPHGDRLRVGYDAQGRVSSVAEYQPEAGDVRRLGFTWVRAGGFERIRSVEAGGALGIRVEYEYDDWGNLRIVRRPGTNVAGEPGAPVRVESYSYSVDDERDRHQLVSATDPNGGRTEIEYYARTDAFPGESANPWRGGVFVLDKQEHVKAIREYPAPGQPVTTSFRFDYTDASAGTWRNTVTDARGNDTAYELNGYGAPIEIREPLGKTTKFEWASDDIFKTREVDALGRETLYDYDARGNLVRERVRTADLGEVVTEYQYDAQFNKLSYKKDAEGHETRYEISDKNGDLLSTTDAVGNVTRYAYDDHGRLVTVTDPRGHVTTQAAFDSFGNAGTVSDPLGNVTTRSYDVRGRQTSQSDTLGHRSETAYDAFDRPSRETRRACVAPCQPPAGIPASADAVTTTDYYPAGQPRSVTNANGAKTSYTLDGMNRVVTTRTALPEGDVYATATVWDGNGNKTQETDRRGVTKAFHYDPLNRLESLEVADGSAGGGPYGTVNAYGYDLAGNKTWERDVAGQTTRFEYDGLYRVARKVLPEGNGSGPYVESYGYDKVGNRVSLTDANGHTTAWQYDALGRVIVTRNALGQESSVTYADPEGSRVDKAEERDVVRGLRTTYAYDALHRETRRDVRLEGAGGNGAVYTTLTAYDDHAHAVRTTDPRGATTLTQLDGLDRPATTVVDETGLALETRTSWDGLGNRRAVRDPNGNVSESTADGLGRQIATTDALGATNTARYDGEGLKVEETDRRGVVTSHTWDSLGRPRRSFVMPSLSGNPWSHEVEYDDVGRQRTERDARGTATVFDLDRMGRVVKETDVLGHAADTTWDGVNRLSVKDKNGHITAYAYDAINRLTTTTDALGQTLVTTYDDAVNVRVEKDRRGTLTRTQLDPLGRVVKVTRAWDVAKQTGVDAETNTWDGNGNRVRQVDAEGHATQLEYDGANRLVKRTDGSGSPAASSSFFEYDANGNRTVEYDERHSKEEPTVRNTFDALNRLASSRDGEGHETRHGYDAEGNRTSTTEPSGAVTTYAYDERGKLVRVTQPGTIETAYDYDENRNLRHQTDANGHVVEMTYDPLNRLRSTVQDSASGGLGLLTLHEYDANGNELLLTDPKGQTVTSTWDQLNRLEAKAWALAPGEPELAWRRTTAAAYGYDANGNLLQVDETVASGTDPPVTLTTTRAYDTLDRLVSETSSLPDGGSATVRHTYYGNGTRASVTDPGGLVTAYTYDAQNRLETATTGSGTASAAVTRYAYYPDDLLREVTYANGVRATHVYDRANRLVSLANARANGSTVSAYVYAYDLNGNRLSQTETNGGRTEVTGYTYDALDRLATVSYPSDASFPSGRVVTYGYDRVGNRERETERDGAGQVLADKQGIFDSLNRLVSLTDVARPADDPARTTTFGWDPNGNQTSKTVGTGPNSVTRYVYDARDKLVEVQTAADLVSAPSAILSRFQYDFGGRRTKKIGEEGLRQYVYDQTSLLTEYDENGSVRAKYDYGSDRLISLTRSDEGRRYFSLDGLRSVVNLTDDAGSTVASYHLDAWGSFRFPTELTASRNRFAFTGHIYDGETGLYNAKARYFDPKLGRFLTQDSYLGKVDNPPSLHRYLYALDNPTLYTDPTGHCPVDCPLGSGMAPEERLKQAQDQTNAAARAAGSLWGTAKWAAKTGWGMLKFAMGMGHEEFGESAVDAAQDPKRATQAYIDGKKREYNESLDRAQQHMLKGEHFAAGAGFTEEFTAPTAADAVIAVEGAGGLGRATLRRTGPAVDRLRSAMQAAAETQARESELAMARAIASGRRSELGSLGPIMTDEQARALLAAEKSTSAGSGDVSYAVNEAGLTVRAEGRISGPHRGRGKGYRPEPVGGRTPGEHRGHLIPEGGVERPSLVNVSENIISETPGSNLGPKKSLDNLVSRMAAENPDSVVRVIAEPLRREGETRPFAVTYWVEKDGVRVTGQTILNR